MAGEGIRMNLNNEEPLPYVSNESVPVWDLVFQDMRDRDKAGQRKYNTKLVTHNGRKPLIDAYQEALDLVVYLRQAIYELYGE